MTTSMKTGLGVLQAVMGPFRKGDLGRGAYSPWCALPREARNRPRNSARTTRQAETGGTAATLRFDHPQNLLLHP